MMALAILEELENTE